MFIPYNINKPIKLGRQDHHILQEIEEKLSKLHISNINEEISSEDDISDIEQQFREDDLDIEKQENEINRLKFKNTYTPRPEARNYYDRPTPPDMQYEESPVRQRALFDGLSIYEWNLDGQTEHQIMNILQEMTMASNAYKTHKNTETQIIEILIAGFTGCLKGWWDNYVVEAEKAIIFKAKKTIVKSENGIQVQTQEDDMVNTLIFAILKNFVGDPSVFKEKSSAILLNLTCRKLSDFRCQIMKIMINEESDISDYEEEDLNKSEDESSSDNDNKSEICDCIGN
ncbi:putative transcription factor interactor and regulator CCHC(Zn) family protein, partial [Tanacetum coccineum]